MLEMPSNLLEFFFQAIKSKGKYEIDIRNNIALLIPREEERYYKPIIRISDLNRFANLLMEYIEAVSEFNKRNNIKLKEYQDLSYVFNIMLFNMTASDASDFNQFIETRIRFFKDHNFEEFIHPNKVFAYNDISFYAQRELEDFGLETPYIMTFSMDVSGQLYDLPMIRYGINEDGVCFIYAIQIGRGRICNVDKNYKCAVNPVNQGVKEHRDISPSFVLILAMFLKILKDHNIRKIVLPDYLFNRYKKYYRASTTGKSNEILSRMFHNITVLIKRLDQQMDGFHIQSYPLDCDSYYHITIDHLDSKNKMLKKLLNRDHSNS